MLFPLRVTVEWTADQVVQNLQSDPRSTLPVHGHNEIIVLVFQY